MAKTSEEALAGKVLACLDRYRLINSGDNVIVALSGGADSVALFHFLACSREKLGIRLGVAHFEHGLRGEESLRDAAYVRTLAEGAGAGFYMEHGDMARRECPKGVGNEEWGRRLRYDFFDRLAAEHGAKIATAHTATDNAETVLFHAIRGAGTRGLSGIPPVRGSYIRPLLLATRAEVEAYCAAHGLHYIQDSYNFNLDYSRNLLRAEVMPLLERAHPGAQASLTRLADDMLELDAYLRGEAEALLARAAGEPKQDGWDADVLLAAPGPVRRTALKLLGGRAADRAALERMERVLEGALGGVQLPALGRVARLRRGRLVLEPPQTPNPAPHRWQVPLREGMLALPGGYRLRVESAPAAPRPAEAGKNPEKQKIIPQKSYTFAADYAKISRCGVFRCRQPGDTFAPGGHTKTLKKWMNEAGIPPGTRGGLPLLCCGSEVLWVWGYGFARSLRPSGATARLLKITVPGESEPPGDGGACDGKEPE